MPDWTVLCIEAHPFWGKRQFYLKIWLLPFKMLFSKYLLLLKKVIK